MDPKPEDIDIKDIAHALGMSCRYTGHTRYFYSVAEHSVLVARECSREHAFWGLMHDASEAYIQDIARPLKPYLTNYAEIEERIMRVIAEKYWLPWPCPPAVKDIDMRILQNERAALLGPEPQPWDLNVAPLPNTRIHAWNPGHAAIEFLIGVADFAPQGLFTEAEIKAWWRIYNV